MEVGTGNSILDFQTLFSDFLELLNGSGLTTSGTGHAEVADQTPCATKLHVNDLYVFQNVLGMARATTVVVEYAQTLALDN